MAGVYQSGNVDEIPKPMKRHYIMTASGILLSSCLVLSQPAKPLPAAVALPKAAEEAGSALTRFDLDFPGGTPEQLVRAIEKASGKPVNAVIPTVHADVQLPPLKMKGVTVPQLFEALVNSSRKTINFQPQRSGSYQQSVTSFGFRSDEARTEDSIWYFYYDKPPDLPKALVLCQFYQLTPYLETYKVEDITTAIQTGWKMLGETNPPTITYHKDTKLLIAVGEAEKLRLIEQVLMALPRGMPVPAKTGEIPKSAPGK